MSSGPQPQSTGRAWIAPVARKWLTSNDARAAYTYVPADSPIPGLYAQDGHGDQAVVYIKLFNPRSEWTWFLTEVDRERGIAFGLVVGFETELGYVDLQELSTCTGSSLPIERDIHWQPCTLADVRKKVGA